MTIEDILGDISIHAPREGSDCEWADYPTKVLEISIHAPREGSDTALLPVSTAVRDFNPRSP